MNRPVLIGLFVLAVGGCASSRTPPPQTTPAPVAAPAPALPESVVKASAAPSGPPAPGEAPRNWQLLDESTDRVPGIGALRAERELLAGRQPRRTVVVAVIDGGVDTAHAGLRANLWSNPRETAGNGKDDDGNGYVDDVHGWNFIGGRDGRDVQYDALEVTRLYARCTAGATAARAAPPLPSEEQCRQITADYSKARSEAEQTLQQVRMAGDVLTRATRILAKALGTDSLTTEKVSGLRPASADVEQAQAMYLQLAANHITTTAVADAKKELESQVTYGLNPRYDPRPIVGDDYSNPTERRYGNPDVMGPDAKHGTHVSGIIAAVRGTSNGVAGIAPAVRVMMVRTVPDGDERDKDVANAIRYAVDNGAQVINMSFGKGYSPYKVAVDDAVKYADSHGVLMIHAAGNDGEDLGKKPSYPTPAYASGGRAQNWIEVGASSWNDADSLAASFSNYGHDQVDVFAPGVDILSTIPGGGYERESGTSMASPVVTGLAALLMSYYPDLAAADVKRIILASATRHTSQMVVRPGAKDGEKVPFGSLSVTGGIVNAYEAIRMAEREKAAKP
ncbi:MAG: S8 family peptidase [Gemmatimonadaceae bacterium]